ncbi:MAG TPA: hypothetical protein VLG37_02150 [Candidatus Saccharimonadales bacterium]|nr:hypothetical protein [Candidatus Saccharimonadales bacterium]
MKLPFKRLKLNSMPAFTSLVAGFFIFCLLGFRLASLTHGMVAELEVQNAQIAGSGWSKLLNNPLNLPYSLPSGLVYHFTHSVFYTRLVGVFFGLVAFGLLYYILKAWHGYKIATIGLLLFGSSAAVLHVARLIDPTVLQMLVPLSLIALGVFSHRKPHSKHSLLLWSLIFGLLLYIPGALWLLILALVLQLKSLSLAWQSASKRLRIVAGLLFVAIIAPLGYYLVKQLMNHGPSGLEPWLGVSLGDINPQNLSLLGKHYLGGLVQVPLQLFWGSGSSLADPAKWLVGLPVLAAISDAFIACGVLVYTQRLRDSRWRNNLLFILLGWLVIGLGGTTIYLVLPIFYLIAAAGVAYLLREWFRVFPRNPLARALGITLILLTLTTAVLYNTRQYFVAWANNPETQAAFRERL